MSADVKTDEAKAQLAALKAEAQAEVTPESAPKCRQCSRLLELPTFPKVAP